MNTQDIEDTLREFALAIKGEENDENAPQGFANRLTRLANDLKRHREFCEAALHPDNETGLAGGSDLAKKLKMESEGSAPNKS
jgi:hypothetical protein